MCIRCWLLPRRRWVRRLRWSRPWCWRSVPRMHRFRRSEQKWTIVRIFPYRIQSLTAYKFVRLFPAPGPWSSQPQGHKTAFKFHRIRCTKCLTSPDNHQKEEYHTCKTWACLIHMSWLDALSLQTLLQKTEVSECSVWLRLKEQITGSPGTSGAAGDLKMADKPQGWWLPFT